MALKDRLNQLFNTQNLKQKQFADILQIGQSTLNNYLNGVSTPNFKNIMLLIEAFPTLNANWLLKGEGEMYLNDELSKNRTIETLNQQIELSEPNPPQYTPSPPPLVTDDAVQKKEIELLMIEVRRLNMKVEKMEGDIEGLKRKGK